MSTPPAGLEVCELDVQDDAAFAAWHHVYATAERHELGDVASVWQLEEVRALMQHPGAASGPRSSRSWRQRRSPVGGRC